MKILTCPKTIFILVVANPNGLRGPGESRGRGDQMTKRPEDHETREQAGQRTRGPQDRKAGRAEDQTTTGPKVQDNRGSEELGTRGPGTRRREHQETQDQRTRTPDDQEADFCTRIALPYIMGSCC